MVRLLLEDVTLVKTAESLTAHVRFRGGATTSLQLPPALTAWQLHQTSPQVVALVDRLLGQHTPIEIAHHLNAEGYVSGAGRRFHARLIERIRHDYRLRTRYDRLRAQGLLTLEETARLLRIDTSTVKVWRRCGLLRGHAHNDKQECLYEDPGPARPVPMRGRKLSDPRRWTTVAADQPQEVQCEA